MTPPTVSTTPPRIPSRLPTAIVLAIIAGAALAAYANTFGVPFLFDDQRTILENPGIRRLWPLWRAFWPQSADLTVSGRPVANFSLALNYALSGSAVWSYHALNLLFHILAGWTLFGVVRRTLPLVGRVVPNAPVTDAGIRIRRVRDNPPYRFLEDGSTLLAFAIALLWTLHPLQTEAVTYLVQRVESLMGLFFLLTLYCFIRAAANEGFAETNHKGTEAQTRNDPSQDSSVPLCLSGSKRSAFGWSALSIIACLLGMGTKEVMATAPVLVLLYDRTFVAGTFRGAWRQRRGLYLSLAATWLVLVGLVASTGWNRGRTAGFNVGVAPWAYWLTQFEAVFRYLQLAVWPHPLVFEYGTFWVQRAGEVAPYAVPVVALALLTLVALRRWPAAGFLGVWFFAILAPTTVVPGKIQMIVEHRMYLPLAAVLTGGVVGLHLLLRRSAVTVTVALALAVALGVITFRRNADYRSELSIWSDAVAKRPGNTRARNGMALALDRAGRSDEAIQQFEEALRLSPGDVEIRDNLGVTLEHRGRVADAIEQYESALRLQPDYPEAHSNLGNALLRQGKIPEANEQYERALRLRPNFVDAHYNLGGALDQAGRKADAIAQFEIAVQLRPDYADAHNNLGNLLHRSGRTAEAIPHYQTALRIRPDFAMAHHNLAVAYEATGRTAEAEIEYEAALLIQPDLAQAQTNLGVLLGRNGRVAEGLAHLREAIRLKPDSGQAHFNLGVALAQAGQPETAMAQYSEALRLQPDLVEAHNNLGMLLGQSGRIPEAIAELQAALRLRPADADAHTNLGNAFLADGRWAEAIAEYEAVLRLRPDDPAARGNLERARAAAAGSGKD